jgi:hypothetical protein
VPYLGGGIRTKVGENYYGETLGMAIIIFDLVSHKIDNTDPHLHGFLGWGSSSDFLVAAQIKKYDDHSH